MKIRAHSLYQRSHWLVKPLGSGAYRSWLIDKGSLTKRLQLRTSDFAVTPTKLENAKPPCDEAWLLYMHSKQTALLREVHLCCEKRPVVFAHSVLPYKSLRGSWQGLSRLGNRSLGTTLFADARVMRTPLEYRKLAKHHALYRRAVADLESAPSALWARRSVFRLRHAVILVTEVFLPGVLAL
ncbi:MAG: chorismate--pyruvate lyase family protein [Methylophilaceae bacterium]